MSVANLLKDIFTGNFTSAGERIKNWWESVTPSVQMFITKVETDEGKILTGLAEAAVPAILDAAVDGKLSTASFLTEAKSIGAQLLAQNITMGQQDIFAALNIAVGAKTAPVAVPSAAPTDQTQAS